MRSPDRRLFPLAALVPLLILACASGARAQVAAEGQLLISEFRLSGPGSGIIFDSPLGKQRPASALLASNPADEFIEIYNNSDAPHTVPVNGESLGYAVVSSSAEFIGDNTPTLRCTVPAGTTIPARGHYLCVNSTGYSLASYAIGDATYVGNIPDNAGLALFNTTIPTGWTEPNRLDAVGSTDETNALYREGAGYPPTPTDPPPQVQYSFFRRLPGGCTGSQTGNCTTPEQIDFMVTPPSPSGFSSDTDDNAVDFLFASIDGAEYIADYQRLGAPGPENLESPTVRTAPSGAGTIKPSLVDPSADHLTAPNRVRDRSCINTQTCPANADVGTLLLRRRFTNNTGERVVLLRFRIMDISTGAVTLPTPPPPPSGPAPLAPVPVSPEIADLRALSSSNGTVTVNNSERCAPAAAPCEQPTVGNTLESPPEQPFGGAFNSSLRATDYTLDTPLEPGESINVNFLFGVMRPGVYRAYVVVEALSDPVEAPLPVGKQKPIWTAAPATPRVWRQRKASPVAVEESAGPAQAPARVAAPETTGPGAVLLSVREASGRITLSPAAEKAAPAARSAPAAKSSPFVVVVRRQPAAKAAPARKLKLKLKRRASARAR